MKITNKWDSQSRCFAGVINFPFLQNLNEFEITLEYSKVVNELEKIRVTCEKITSRYFFILHDSDLDETGKKKIYHVHFVLLLSRAKMTKTVFGYLVDYLQYPENCISIENVISSVGVLRYLVHMDNPDKFQYSIDNVICRDKVEFIALLDCPDELNYDYLKMLVESANDITDIIKYIGVGKFERYFRTIKLVFETFHKTKMEG